MPLDPTTGQMIPTPPSDYVPPAPGQSPMPGGPQGTVPVFNQGAQSPGISGAIQQAVKALAMAIAPSVHKANQAKISGALAEGGGTPSQSQTTDLGNQF
jgi:hypothetical protein